MKTPYKTAPVQRQRALAHYYANRERMLAYMTRWRRAHGIKPRRKMTDQEKLERQLTCSQCGKEIKTPTLKRQGSSRCLRCLRACETNDKRRTRLRKRRQQINERFKAYKATLVCLTCGATRSLDFHHRDPTTKFAKVSSLASQVSWSRLWREIEKCDVLCKTCHKTRHKVSGA